MARIRINGYLLKNTPKRIPTESKLEYARFTERETLVSNGFSCKKFGTCAFASSVSLTLMICGRCCRNCIIVLRCCVSIFSNWIRSALRSAVMLSNDVCFWTKDWVSDWTRSSRPNDGCGDDERWANFERNWWSSDSLKMRNESIVNLWLICHRRLTSPESYWNTRLAVASFHL